MFEKIYVVSKKLVLATNDEVDRLRTIGLPLPLGYREYVTQLGKGAYSENLLVWLPGTVLERLQEQRQMHSKYFEEFYPHSLDQPIEQADVAKCVQFADTENGDSIIVCPRLRRKLFFLPTQGEQIRGFQHGFKNPRALVKFCFDGQWEPEFDFFEPSSPDQKCFPFAYKTSSSAEMIASLFEQRFSGGLTRRDQMGDGPGGYLRLFVERLSARVNISWDKRLSKATLYITLDTDKKPELDLFLAEACTKLRMKRMPDPS